MTLLEVLTSGWQGILVLALIYSIIALLLISAAKRFLGLIVALIVGFGCICYLIVRSQHQYESFDQLLRASYPHGFATYACPRTFDWVGFNFYPDGGLEFYRDCYATPISIVVIGLMLIVILSRGIAGHAKFDRN